MWFWYVLYALVIIGVGCGCYSMGLWHGQARGRKLEREEIAARRRPVDPEAANRVQRTEQARESNGHGTQSKAVMRRRR